MALCLLARLARNIIPTRISLWLILAWAAGLQWALVGAQSRLWVPAEIFITEHTIKGAVISAPIQYTDYTQFEFKLTEHCDLDGNCHDSRIKVRLSLKGKTPIKLGDTLSLQASFRRPHSLRNPGTALKLKHFYMKGIVATGSVKTIFEHHPLKPGFRERLASKIDSKSQESGILKALVVGIQQDITPEQWQIFRKTGTSHLIAISGLHVGLVAGAVYYLVFWGIGLIRRDDRFAVQPFACIASVCAAFCYSALAGFSIPTMRACIMICVVMLFQVTVRQIPKINLLMLAVFAVLLIDPSAVLSAGFWLSFGAVGWLLLLGHGGKSHPLGVKTLVSQIKLCLGLMPLSLAWFSQTSLISPITNMIAIPWMSMCVVPFALVGALLPVPYLDSCCLWVAHTNLQLLMTVMDIFAKDFFLFEKHLDACQISLLTLGCLILFLPFFDKRFALLCFVPVFCFPKYHGIKSGEFNVHFLDVGQGTSVVIELANHRLIYDFGARGQSFDAGKQVIVPFLKTRDTNTIDLAIVSHADIDHYGGFDSVGREMHIKESMTSNDSLFPASRLCRQGDAWTWDEVRFEVLHPQEPLSPVKNNQSCVIKISNHSASVLLTGDIEAGVEQILVDQHLQSDILLVPHHGSLTSSTERFIEMVNPTYAVITAGRYNRYHLPKAKILNRYRQQGIQLFNTFETGMISFKVSSHGVSQPKLWSIDRAKLWDLLTFG